MGMRNGSGGGVFRFLFFLQAGVNLVGALGAELSFDALWYHLPIARLIAERGWWGVIPGGLLYYSGLPRVMEFVNAFLLSVGSRLGFESPEILVKLLHLLFGMMSAGMIFRIARRYSNAGLSWMAAALWYSTLTVGWLSISSYVDLVRICLVLVSAWYFLEFAEKGRRRAVVSAAVFMGLAYSTKMMSIVDALLLSVLIGCFAATRLDTRGVIWTVSKYVLTVSFFVLFWGILNLIHGYNFFYPLFSKYNFMSDYSIWRYDVFFGPIWVFFDPRYRTGPAALILLIGVVFCGFLKNKKYRALVFLTATLTLSWYLIPRTGMGRFFLLPLALILTLVAAGFADAQNNWKKWGVAIAILQSTIGVVYRGVANAKFVPYLLGNESKEEFLARELKFDYGDYYDVGKVVEKEVGQKRYLVVGVHNTYYLPGKFDHESWAEDGYCYPYALVRGEYGAKESWQQVIYQPLNQSTLYRDESCDAGESER